MATWWMRHVIRWKMQLTCQILSRISKCTPIIVKEPKKLRIVASVKFQSLVPWINRFASEIGRLQQCRYSVHLCGLPRFQLYLKNCPSGIRRPEKCMSMNLYSKTWVYCFYRIKSSKRTGNAFESQRGNGRSATKGACRSERWRKQHLLRDEPPTRVGLL
jgi:hypothetical protein